MNNSENIGSSRRTAARTTDCGKENGDGNTEAKPPRSLEEINEAHIRGIDKFYRMYAGGASNLVGFHGGYIYLEIRVDDRLSIPLEKLTRNIANSWCRQNELRGAVGYCALIYKSARWSGFVLEPGMTAQQLEEATRRLTELANEPDVFVKMIEEVYCSAGSSSNHLCSTQVAEIFNSCADGEGPHNCNQRFRPSPRGGA